MKLWNFDINPLYLLLAWIVWKVLVVIYRVSPLHPLSGFPGPRIAAATAWYETYYDMYKGAKFSHQLERLHKIYGPVVRYGPNILHFKNPDDYLAIYNVSSGVTKDPSLYKSFTIDQSTFGEVDPKLAKARRDVLNPFFSTRNIKALQGVITSRLEVLCQKIQEQSVKSQDPLNLGRAIRSLTMDIILEFCFAESINATEYPGFSHPLLVAAQKTLPTFTMFRHFPLVRTIMMGIPRSMAMLLFGESHGVHKLESGLYKQLDSFLTDPQKLEKTEHPIIYHRLLDPNAKGSRGMPSRKRLFEEAQLMFLAGSDTVGNTLSIGSVYILSNPNVRDRMVAEIMEHWEDKSHIPPLEEVEKWPYLTAVIKESLRLAHGVVAPLRRITPKQGALINGLHIPGGVGVAGTAQMVHLNHDIFPNPSAFDPERWLGPKGKELDKYLCAFSKGPRLCLGMNLAYAELYLGFATLYRRFEMELYQTSVEMLGNYEEHFAPYFKGIALRAQVKPRVN